jgi:hypothetical protein
MSLLVGKYSVGRRPEDIDNHCPVVAGTQEKKKEKIRSKIILLGVHECTWNIRQLLQRILRRLVSTIGRILGGLILLRWSPAFVVQCISFDNIAWFLFHK